MDDIDNENAADWGEPSDVHPITFSPVPIAKSDDAAIIRVEGTIRRSWRGVSNCCSQSRVDSEFATAFQSFIDEQKASHPTLTFVTAGHGQGTGECRRWDNPPNGRRCNGWISAPGWVDFTQPEG